MTEGVKVFKYISMKLLNVSKESLEKYITGACTESSDIEIVIGDIVTKWRLMVYPNGLNENFKSNIGFYLQLKEASSTTFSFTCRMGILDKKKYLDLKAPWNCNGDDYIAAIGQGTHSLISHKLLFNEENHFIIDGSLSLVCQLILTIPKQAPDDVEKRLSMSQSLALGLKKMFEDDLFTDFTLTTSDDVTFSAHKAVLAARSPVFFAMLTNDMQEAKENAANVPDFDSSTLLELLRFIYCNEVEDLNKVAHELIYAAEKYQLGGDLKEMCVDSIVSSLTTENVLKSLMIACRVSETINLFDECVDFIVQNFVAVSDTEEWKDLPKDCMLRVIQGTVNRHDKQCTLQSVVDIDA